MSNDVRVDVSLDTKQAEKDAEGFKGKILGAFGDMSKIAGGMFMNQGASAAVGFLKDAAIAAAEDEAATKRLDQALRNAGGAFDENKAKVEARIKAGQDLAFTDDQVRDSFQQLLAATGDTDEALRRQALAMDFSRGAGISLEQASRLLGKVTDENVEAFKRMGITIGEGATEAEAFAVIQGKFAGQSEAYAKSTAGQFEQAKIRMSEVKEEIGAKLLPVITQLALVFLNDVVPAIEKFVAVAGPAISKFATDVKGYWESDIKPAIDNLIAAWQKVDQVVIPILAMIVKDVARVAEAVALSVGIIVDLLQGDFSGAWEKAKEIVNLAIEAIRDKLMMLKDIGTKAIEGMRDGIVETWNTWVGPFFKRLPQTILDLIGDLGRLLFEAGADLIRGLVKGMLSIPIPNPLDLIKGNGSGSFNTGAGSGYSSSVQPLTGGGGGGGGGVPTGAYGLPLQWNGTNWYDANAGAYNTSKPGGGVYYGIGSGGPGGVTIIQNIENVGSGAEAKQMMGDAAWALAAQGV